MKRSGFTMIELVFIIVILGILGAIAVPKMAASRNDARVVAIKSDVGTFAQAIPAMAMSQNNADTIDFKANPPVSLNQGNWAFDDEENITIGNTQVRGVRTIWSKIKKDGGSEATKDDACVVITIDGTNKRMTITHRVNTTADAANPICNRIAGLADNAAKENIVQTIELTGKGVTF